MQCNYDNNYRHNTIAIVSLSLHKSFEVIFNAIFHSFLVFVFVSFICLKKKHLPTIKSLNDVDLRYF